MYTSVHEANTAEYLKRAKIYLILAIVCCLIGAVYEHFSFGVYSNFMLYAFAVPLLCGALPALLLGSSRRPRTIPRWSMKLADAGIAAWTVGSFFRGDPGDLRDRQRADEMVLDRGGDPSHVRFAAVFETTDAETFGKNVQLKKVHAGRLLPACIHDSECWAVIPRHHPRRYPRRNGKENPFPDTVSGPG